MEEELRKGEPGGGRVYRLVSVRVNRELSKGEGGVRNREQ